MELRELLKVIVKKKLLLLGFAVLGVIIGVAIYKLPTKYLTTGAFFVKREVALSPDFFTYEGYYAQQTAVGYTNNVIALLDSVDVQSNALQKVGINVDEKTLRKYSNYIKIKKVGPQVITVTVKGNSVESSSELWKALSEELTTTVKKTNAGGDVKLTVSQVSDYPVVKKEYKSLWLNIPVGILVGFSLGVFLISLKEYE